MARFGNPLQVRIRALRGLGEEKSDESLAQLLESASNGSRSSIKAAALMGLIGHVTRLSSTDQRYTLLTMIVKEGLESKDRRIYISLGLYQFFNHSKTEVFSSHGFGNDSYTVWFIVSWAEPTTTTETDL